MYIAIDVGGTKVQVASFVKGKIKQTYRFSTTSDFETTLNQISELAKLLASEDKIEAVGVAAPGPIDFARGQILDAPNLHWHHPRVVDALEKALGAPVVLENDAAAAGYAETLMGAGKDANSVLYVTIGTGIGTGVIINQQIYHGARGTEGGHMIIDPEGPECNCGGRGHFETFVSGPAIERRFGRPAHEIYDKPTWDKIAADMALGLVNMITLLSPNVVILGGGVSVHWARFKSPLARHLKAFKRPYLPKVVRAKFVETAPLYGAELLARRHFESGK